MQSNLSSASPTDEQVIAYTLLFVQKAEMSSDFICG